MAPAALRTKAPMDVAASMNAILAQVFVLYLKTQYFHSRTSGPLFRDCRLLLDEQADQLYAMADSIAERILETGDSASPSNGHVARRQRIIDNDSGYVDPLDMLAELRDDNLALAARLREVHSGVDELGDIATASMVETWIEETERRMWFLCEFSRRDD
jgi:starvation-inducible DNA-binding protein